MDFSTNPQLKLAYEFVQFTGRNVFLTGKAGTGKTTFLHFIKKNSTKRAVVVAPTGVAAINAGGVTIHSFFQIAPGLFLPDVQIRNAEGDENPYQRVSKIKIDIIRSLDLLIIDEISMVRADLLDAIDQVLRRYRYSSKPFGGVQLLLIGDLQQLAPVVKDDERDLLAQHYQSTFFFGSHALQKTEYISVELKHVYRQSDQDFIDLLNRVRDNRLDLPTLDKLNSRFQPGILSGDNPGYITLTTHNYQAQQINESRLERLKGKPEYFQAKVSGEFPETSYPTEKELVLKKGAQVMFVKNDSSPEKLFYNGKIGQIVDIDDDIIYVECEGDENTIPVTPLTWENRRYNLNPETKEITEQIIGTFTQFPLKLAWAITIHKSQGLTFERAIIDAEAAFAHGQVYVALSRCKTMEGMILSSRISTYSVKSDNSVAGFNQNVAKNQPDEKVLKQAQYEFQLGLLQELFDFSNIRKLAYTLQKNVLENVNILNSFLPAKAKAFIDNINAGFYEVGIKFSNEINRHAQTMRQVEQNPVLQERLSKAVDYYLPKLEAELRNPLATFDLDCDNKQVSKTLNDLRKKMEWELQIKRDSMASCTTGFKTPLFLEAKAKAAIESPDDRRKLKPKTAQKTAMKENEESDNPQLYELLRQWRDVAAEQLNLPIYTILPRRTMVQITNQLPANFAALRKIHGMGKVKTEKFGNDLISIVLEYCANNNLKPSYEKTETIDLKTKESSKNTKLISYEMFKEGKTIEEIAEERKFVASTILGHLAHYVQLGEIPVNKLVSQEKVELISNFYSGSEDTSMNAAKEAFGDKIDYADIKVVLAHMAFLEGNG
jgi:hypothetical protein